MLLSISSKIVPISLIGEVKIIVYDKLACRKHANLKIFLNLPDHKILMFLYQSVIL